jgi:hypothetical protein
LSRVDYCARDGLDGGDALSVGDLHGLELPPQSGVRSEVVTAGFASAAIGGVESHRRVQHHRHPCKHGRKDER